MKAVSNSMSCKNAPRCSSSTFCNVTVQFGRPASIMAAAMARRSASISLASDWPARASHRVAQRRDQRHDENQGEDEHAEAFRFVAPIDEQEQRGDEEGAHRERLVEVADGDALQHRADGKRRE